MATVIIYDPFLAPGFDRNECNFSYPAYKALRHEIPFDTATKEKYEASCDRFRDQVAERLQRTTSDPVIQSGQYFVFAVQDLLKVIAMGEDADFVQFYNRLDENGYNKLMAIAFKSPMVTGAGQGELVLTDKSYLVEGLPCPPHPHCPTVQIEFI